MASLVTFAKKLWKDATSGGTPITAAELNRMESGINDCATQINRLGDSVSHMLIKNDIRELNGDDLNAIGTCFQAIYQRTAWTAKQNGPVGTSSYGFLFSARGGDSDIQIFIDTSGHIAFRLRFSGNASWGAWTVIGA